MLPHSRKSPENQYKMVYFGTYCALLHRIKGERHTKVSFYVKNIDSNIAFSALQISNNALCICLFSGHPNDTLSICGYTVELSHPTNAGDKQLV